jgi:hypothetical protein
MLVKLPVGAVIALDKVTDVPTIVVMLARVMLDWADFKYSRFAGSAEVDTAASLPKIVPPTRKLAPMFTPPVGMSRAPYAVVELEGVLPPLIVIEFVLGVTFVEPPVVAARIPLNAGEVTEDVEIMSPVLTVPHAVTAVT